MKIFCIDIDNTLFESTYPCYTVKGVRQDVIDTVNQLYEDGNFIRLYTARGTCTGIDWSREIHDVLVRAGVRFHEIKYGKPAAHYYVDDKAMTPEQFVKEFKE